MDVKITFYQARLCQKKKNFGDFFARANKFFTPQVYSIKMKAKFSLFIMKKNITRLFEKFNQNRNPYLEKYR